MDSTGGALERLCNPVSEVSAHYLIGQGGEVFRMVDEECRAWHAGAGSWGGAGDVNSRSIGIELDNDGQSPFAAPLMTALEDLLGDILSRWDIPAEGVIAHSDMAPDRKDDPGELFDWDRLVRAGLAVGPSSLPTVDVAQDRPPDAADFHNDLARFGYPVPPEVPADDLLRAFRSRFRTGSGRLGPQDCAAAAALARGWPYPGGDRDR